VRPNQPHLLVDISAHGYGHASMTAAVVNELVARLPRLLVTVRTSVRYDFLSQRFSCSFRHIPVAFDFGMHMGNALDIEIQKSLMAYNTFHTNWEGKVDREAAKLGTLQPDLLLSNIPYLTLAAARRSGVRAVGLCCINWADIYRHFAVDNNVTRSIHVQMVEAYNSADIFFRVSPAMPMQDLSNLRDLSPIAGSASNRRVVLAHRLSLKNNERVVLVTMGGMDFFLQMQKWEPIEGVHWLVPGAWKISRSDMTGFERLGIPFSDILASCDAVLTKPGYNTFVEAACAGVPVLYVARGKWPEEPFLVQWMRENGVCLEVDRLMLDRGTLQEALIRLREMPAPPRPTASGAAEVAAILQEKYFSSY